MRLNKIVCALISVFGVNTAFAAISCTTVETPVINVGSTTVIAEPSTCTKNTNMGATAIGGASGVAGWQQGTTHGISIFEVDLAASNAPFTIAVTSAQFHPQILLGGPDATCEDAASDINDASGSGDNTSFTVSTAQTAGKYWLFVGDTTGGPGDAGCGTFSLEVSGALPVKLEKFSVE